MCGVNSTQALRAGGLAAALATACMLAAPLAAEEPGNPLDQAEAVLLVRDGRWVDREATRFAAAYGGELGGLRGQLARVLFRTAAFTGIDLSRPSLLAWRPGRSPLLAVIPISNRTQFLASFGAVAEDEPPLVRTGEREGTVIYRQNQPGGEWEYRLLVAGSVAYVARTVDECRRLAELVGQPAHDPAAAPLELRLRGGAIRSPRIPGFEALAALPALPCDLAEFGAVPGLAANAWTPLAEQLESIGVTARSDAQGELVLGARLVARHDSSLAAWISAQRPGTERLAGQLRSPASVMLVSGRLSFQGQAERWAFEQADTLKAAAGARWNDAADGAYRGLCTLLERSGAFALGIERHGQGVVQAWVAEHPRAIEMVQSAAAVFAALHGGEAEAVRIGQRGAVQIPAKPGASVFVAGDRHAVRIDDRGARRGTAAAAELLQRLDEPGGLDAVPALVTAWIDLGRAWGAPPPADGTANEPVELRAILRPAAANALDLQVRLPLAGVGRILGRLNKTTRND